MPKIKIFCLFFKNSLSLSHEVVPLPVVIFLPPTQSQFLVPPFLRFFRCPRMGDSLLPHQLPRIPFFISCHSSAAVHFVLCEKKGGGEYFLCFGLGKQRFSPLLFSLSSCHLSCHHCLSPPPPPPCHSGSERKRSSNRQTDGADSANETVVKKTSQNKIFRFFYFVEVFSFLIGTR